MLFYQNKCIGCGKCKEKCPSALENCTLCGKCTVYCPADARDICGKAYGITEVLTEILKDKTLYETSGGGVTFSGGECMLQIDFLEELLKECKSNGINTAVDTAGHVPFESFQRILPYTDVFLYDVKCYGSEKHKRYTGVGNELILENLRKLLTTQKRIWIRIPIIPDVNDTEEEMQSIRQFLDNCGHPEKIELLPYHAMGEHKYAALNQTAHQFSVPDKEKLSHLKNVFL